MAIMVMPNTYACAERPASVAMELASFPIGLFRKYSHWVASTARSIDRRNSVAIWAEE